MFKAKKAQGTLEYIIIFTAIVAAILLAANTVIKTRVGNILDHATDQAEKSVKKINF
jgi:hypothetical protein